KFMNTHHEQDILKRNAELEKELAAKNRELEIEASLEKVRTQALAMQMPDDLLNVCKVLFKELSLLGFSDIRNAVIHTFNDDENYFIDYDYSDLTGGIITNIPYSDHPVIKRFLKQIRKSDEAFAEVIVKGKELNEWKKFRKRGGQPDDPRLDKTSALYYYFHSVGTGDIGISTFSSINEEKRQLLKRFRNVFDLAYKRYTDIRKAEAQLRDAQIEASLERVRSRSMAMHHSNDLQQVIQVVTDQLLLLGFKFNTANFAKVYADVSWDLWLSTPEQSYPDRIYVPYFDHKIFNQLKDIIAKKLDFFTDVYDKKDSNKFFRHFFENTIARNAPEPRKQFVFNSKGFARSLFLMKDLWLFISNYDGILYTAEENAVFKRFATVFEQAYIRFLDLQKAETQAREAEIELALERVRAKTMAMQKPSEFLEVINVVGEQFIHLGFDIEWANFGANGLEVAEGIDIWNFAVIPGYHPMSARVFIPYFDHPVFIKAVEGLDECRKTGNDFFILAFGKDDKDRWLDHLFTKTVFKDVPGEYRAIQYAKPGYTTSNLALKDTWLSIGKFDVKNFTDEQHSILRKFGNAFGQAYTRFLDLQKAEAQSREAQIELGLERVRARTMAMQRSDELRETVLVIYEQLRLLNFESNACNIIIIDKESGNAQYWVSGFSQEIYPVSYAVPYLNHPYHDALLKPWKQGDKYVVYEYTGKMKQNFDEIFFTQTEFRNVPDEAKNVMIGLKSVTLSTAFISYGALQSLGAGPLSDENANILQRFAKVFEQTYTRFLDLKKAEAQTRESQIELGLERVRARAMAMQNSDELKELIGSVFIELTKLDLVLTRCVIMIYDGL